MPKVDGLLDRRVVARNLKHGRLTRKEYEAHLASLPDVSTKAVPMFSEARVAQIPTAAVAEDDDEDEGEDGEGEDG